MSAATAHVGRIVAAETDLVVVPRSGGAGKRVVLVAHGANSKPLDFTVPGIAPGVFRHLHAITEAGFVAVVADWGGLQTWGTDVVLTRFDTIMTWVAANLPGVLTDKALFWGESMGNWTALRCAADRASQVAAVVANIPLCDITNIRASNALGSRALIDAAWGVTYPAALPARGNLLARAPIELVGLPWKGYTGSADTACPPSTVTALVSAIGATASSVTCDTTHDHGDAIAAAADTADMVAFLQAYAA